MKKLFILLFVVFALASCSEYTCPTYSGTNKGPNKYNVGKAVMVKHQVYYAKRK